MKFRLTWRNKHKRTSGVGCWQNVRDGIEAWLAALNASTNQIAYALEYAEGEAAPNSANRFHFVERDGL